MQRLADHAVDVVPRGLNVVVLVAEPAPPGQSGHAALATRTSGLDVPEVLRSFADDLDQRRAARARTAVQGDRAVRRLAQHASLKEVRETLERAVAEGLNTIVLSPERLLNLLNQGLS